ncbi:hypothetical protein I7I51_09152 [Histoplasma capsulatum]|uniref:Uncharacterized protein n=1 Tax=Ajellomyces capsulatus TaxID=5037 RepID=A0A8A1LZW3_AJECA|nr:hypothetical protein I7I51_09152 [Histoplasma capsulatum]
MDPDFPHPVHEPPTPGYSPGTQDCGSQLCCCWWSQCIGGGLGGHTHGYIYHYERNHLTNGYVGFLLWATPCRTEEKAKPTIVRSSRSGSVYTSGDWSNILSEMNLIIRSQERATFAVEFLPGSSPQINSTEDSEKGELGVSYLYRLDTESPLEMGCSIGVNPQRPLKKRTVSGCLQTERLLEGTYLILQSKISGATQKDADDSIKGLQQQLQESKSEQHDQEVAGAHHSIRIQKGIENSEKLIKVFEAT